MLLINNIEDKSYRCFISFDKKDHLKNAIEIGKKSTKFAIDDIELIAHRCQKIVCYDNRILSRLNIKDNFDIAMGSFHGAEVCVTWMDYLS